MPEGPSFWLGPLVLAARSTVMPRLTARGPRRRRRRRGGRSFMLESNMTSLPSGLGVPRGIGPVVVGAGCGLHRVVVQQERDSLPSSRRKRQAFLHAACPDPRVGPSHSWSAGTTAVVRSPPSSASSWTHFPLCMHVGGSTRQRRELGVAARRGRIHPPQRRDPGPGIDIVSHEEPRAAPAACAERRSPGRRRSTSCWSAGPRSGPSSRVDHHVAPIPLQVRLIQAR